MNPTVESIVLPYVVCNTCHRLRPIWTFVASFNGAHVKGIRRIRSYRVALSYVRITTRDRRVDNTVL